MRGKRRHTTRGEGAASAVGWGQCSTGSEVHCYRHVQADMIPDPTLTRGCPSPTQCCPHCPILCRESPIQHFTENPGPHTDQGVSLTSASRPSLLWAASCSPLWCSRAAWHTRTSARNSSSRACRHGRDSVPSRSALSAASHGVRPTPPSSPPPDPHMS